MDRTITDALRRAASLTRAGRPFEATEAIQAALSGSPPPPSEEGETGRSSRPSVPPFPTLDLEATRIDPDRTASTAAPKTAAPAGGAAGRGRVGRFTRPLAETIRDLAALRRTIETTPAGRAGPPPIPDGARWLTRTFASVHGSRDYRVYVPARTSAGRPAGLVLMLHGCKQDPDDFAVGTGMNVQAGATGMIVVYPAQTRRGQPVALLELVQCGRPAAGRR